jgi:hypothetical protein
MSNINDCHDYNPDCRGECQDCIVTLFEYFKYASKLFEDSMEVRA